MASEDWREVARLCDLPEGAVRRIEVAGRTLALVKAEGVVRAVSAVCPHQGGPLDQGTIWQGTLECPWHHFLFDLETGANVYPANVYPQDMPQLRAQLRPVDVYPVRIEDGRVLVKLPA
jgi:3-phenylpropionate/trans-cinnamate dioxygenase ferredoxin subunit